MIMYPQSAVHMRMLKVWCALREAEAAALSVDHLDPAAWNYPVNRRGKELHGGILWWRIQQLHCELRDLTDQCVFQG